MRAIRPFGLTLFALALLLVVACGDDTLTNPQPAAPHANLIGSTLDATSSVLRATGLLSCSRLPADTDTETIGVAGGTLDIGPHKLVIPAGALNRTVKITASIVRRGGANAVHFEPEGLQFRKAASLTMSYANCNLLGSLAAKRIAYTSNTRTILEYLVSVDDLLRQRVTGELRHFSDYAIAW